MKLQQQVTSLELSKKLKELGVKQESLFYWCEYRRWENEDNKMVEQDTVWEIDRSGVVGGNGHSTGRNFSAFTVAELGEMLYLHSEHFIKAYGDVFDFPGTGRVGDLGIINLMRRPDMGAKMLIYLLENKLISL